MTQEKDFGEEEGQIREIDEDTIEISALGGYLRIGKGALITNGESGKMHIVGDDGLALCGSEFEVEGHYYGEICKTCARILKSKAENGDLE